MTTFIELAVYKKLYVNCGLRSSCLMKILGESGET